MEMLFNPIAEELHWSGQYHSIFCSRLIFYKTMQYSMFLETENYEEGFASAAQWGRATE